MRCPRCDVPMPPTRVVEMSIHLCTTCGGTWLDNRACRALAGNALPEDAVKVIDVARTVGADAAPAGYRTPVASHGAERTQLACPVCSVDLVSYESNEERQGVKVKLDACALHGTWFDRGEAWALYQGIALSDLAIAYEIATEARERAWDERERQRWVGFMPVRRFRW